MCSACHWQSYWKSCQRYQCQRTHQHCLNTQGKVSLCLSYKVLRLSVKRWQLSHIKQTLIRTGRDSWAWVAKRWSFEVIGPQASYYLWRKRNNERKSYLLTLAVIVSCLEGCRLFWLSFKDQIFFEVSHPLASNSSIRGPSIRRDTCWCQKDFRCILSTHKLCLHGDLHSNS